MAIILIWHFCDYNEAVRHKPRVCYFKITHFLESAVRHKGWIWASNDLGNVFSLRSTALGVLSCHIHTVRCITSTWIDCTMQNICLKHVCSCELAVATDSETSALPLSTDGGWAVTSPPGAFIWDVCPGSWVPSSYGSSFQLSCFMVSSIWHFKFM